MTSYLEYHRFIIAWLIAAVRIGTAFAICPALSDSMIMGTARRAAVLAFSLIVTPVVLASIPVGCEPPLRILVPIAIREALIGLIIGFVSGIPFWVAENVGNFIDNQRGATMGEVYSPLSGEQVSTIGIFFTQLVSTLFFASGAFVVLLGALYASYGVWPIFHGIFAFASDAPVTFLASMDAMLRDTVVISAPPVILMFLANLGLGLVNRTAPQLNVFFLSMPVKSALSIAMLVLYLPFVMDKLMYTREMQLLGPVMRMFR